MKRPTLLFLVIVLFPFKALAMCENEAVSFEFYLSSTLELAYEAQGIPTAFSEGDFLVVTLKDQGMSYRLDQGSLSDDGAGNYDVEGSHTTLDLEISLYHDHETWHQDGLQGYVQAFGQTYDLSSIKDCSWDKLFY